MNNTAIALGTFDGVHLGHVAVLRAAAESGFESVAVAFRVPPKSFFTTDGIILTLEKEKTRLIKETGFPLIKDVSPNDFFDSLVDKYSPALIACGYDYTFGKGGKGDTKLLEALCCEKGIKLTVIDKVTLDGEPISSSRIRTLLKNGDVKKAASLLKRDFSVVSEVLHGDERGRTIGFPTFNQLYPKNVALVKFGVYMTKAVIDDKEYFGMTNIGIRPTFPLNSPLCETNLFDFTGNLYGKAIRLYLLDFIREEKRFNSVSELKEALIRDKNTILEKQKNRCY